MYYERDRWSRPDGAREKLFRVIEFKELGKDGVAFEQLVRELLLNADLVASWTGQGPDDGRDLVAEEVAEGPLGSFRRRWLVQCKHKAHSARAVSKADIASVLDDCRQVNANGYLLACTTHPSTAVVRKLTEIAAEPANRLVTAIWDGVEIEKRLSQPANFGLGQLFFPESTSRVPWRIYNMGGPQLWAAHHRGYFFYLSSRIAANFPSIGEVEAIVDRLQALERSESEDVRIRAVYFDEKHEQFTVFADYLVPEDAPPTARPEDFNTVLLDGQGLHRDGHAQWFITYWDVRLVRTKPLSDRYQPDAANYYEPFVRNFELGSSRGRTVGEIEIWR